MKIENRKAQNQWMETERQWREKEKTKRLKAFNDAGSCIISHIFARLTLVKNTGYISKSSSGFDSVSAIYRSSDDMIIFNFNDTDSLLLDVSEGNKKGSVSVSKQYAAVMSSSAEYLMIAFRSSEQDSCVDGTTYEHYKKLNYGIQYFDQQWWDTKAEEQAKL